MDMYGLPPQVVERVVCSISAASKYQIPADIVLAVAEKESGKPGLWRENTNGSFDIGSMQINTDYLKDLSKYGISSEDVAVSGCYPFELAAWRLRKHLRDDKGDIWQRAANYHSRTPEYNAIYRADLIVKANKWSSWLANHFKTNNVTIVGAKPTQENIAAINESSYQHRTKNDADMNRAYKNTSTKAAYVPRGLVINSNR